MKLNFGRAELEGPILIPSISSFETQYGGRDALALQTILTEPISLISAYDIHNDPKLVTTATDFQKSGGILFVDSGGYEFSRSQRYFPPGSESIEEFKELLWNQGKYYNAIEGLNPDLVASFDEFLCDNESIEGYIKRLITFFSDHQEVIGSNLVPVIHIQNRSGSKKLQSDDTLRLFSEVSHALDSSYIAIPERELGLGLIERTNSCRAIVRRLREGKRATMLHVLGCGNPLSFAFLASVGVALADGLEWCRTQYGPNFHLHHFQQFDVLNNEGFCSLSDTATYLLENQRAGNAKILIRNLAMQQAFSEGVRRALKEDSIVDFVSEYFPVEKEVLNALAK